MPGHLYSQRYREFLRKLRQARTQAKFTQKEASAHLGKYASYVVKCEKGDRRVDLIELLEFAELYEKDVAFFLPKHHQPGQD